MPKKIAASRLTSPKFPVLFQSCSSRPFLNSGHSYFIRICNPTFPLASTSQFRKLSTQSIFGLSQIKQPEAQHRTFIFRSSSTDPYVNLSLEHYLLQHAHPESRILFLYVNRPCVVIGRNQNPWVECALQKLSQQQLSLRDGAEIVGGGEQSGDGDGTGEVLFVRRRSGGGAVFHDEGNLNYSVIVPSHARAEFKRKTHAEMVVRAVRGVQRDLVILSKPFEGRKAAAEMTTTTTTTQLDTSAGEKMDVRVNDRNDIVMNDPDRGVLKVGGSAFKLTRGRALHHGTLLFSSPNLNSIGEFLRSPARYFISAKGVESVRSPVRNLFETTNDERLRKQVRWWLETGIASEFRRMYGEEANAVVSRLKGSTKLNRREPPEDIGSEMDAHSEAGAEIMKGVREIMSPEWKFEQTPGFVVSNKPVLSEKGFSPPTDTAGLPEGANVFLRVKSGTMQEVEVSLSNEEAAAMQENEQVRSRLKGRKLHEISDWRALFDGLDAWTHPAAGRLVDWLSEMLPPLTKKSTRASDHGRKHEKIENERQEASIFERKRADGVLEVEAQGEAVVEEIQSHRDSRRQKGSS